MPNLKVLSLLWGFSLGGISKYAINLNQINKLDGVALEIETACIFSKAWGCDLKPLSEINAHLIPISGRSDLSWISRTSKLIDLLRPDLLLVHGFNGPVIAQICKLRSRHSFDFVSTYHGQYSAPKPSRRFLVPIFNHAQEWLYKGYSKSVLSVCDHSSRYLLKKGVPAEKVVTIHNGIISEAVSGDRHELRSDFGFSETDFVIGAASRLEPMKGLNYLIDSVPKILNVVPHAKFVIFGNGVSEQDLADKCEDMDISHAVNFTGYRADVPQVMNALDLFALPSLAECHSIGLLEAMRAGLPIVATDVGGNPESISDGISGLIVPPKDANSLATAIISCANNQSFRESLGKKARIRFENEFTLEKHLRCTADWLLSCVDLRQ